MKLYLSSAESKENSNTLLSVPRKKNVLVTFFYLRGKKDETVRDLLEKFKLSGDSIMLDSGAFTFLDNDKKTKAGSKKRKEMAIGKYFTSYIEFLKKWSSYFDLIVELDIDKLVGYEVVSQWRKELELVVPAEKLVCVFHETIPEWRMEVKQWCEKGYVVGVGGRQEENTLKAIFQIVKQYKGRTHGFAKTGNDIMVDYPWYSVDSSSWNTGKRFGSIFSLDKKKFPYFLKGLTLKDVRRGDKKSIKIFKERVLKSALKYIKFSISDLIWDKKASALIDKININTFLDYEIFITEYWNKK